MFGYVVKATRDAKTRGFVEAACEKLLATSSMTW